MDVTLEVSLVNRLSVLIVESIVTALLIFQDAYALRMWAIIPGSHASAVAVVSAPWSRAYF